MKVGFIGLGHMGAGIGAEEAATVSGACRGDVVITMLSNDEAVESVVFGPNGILETLRPGALRISSSTISIALAVFEALGEAFALVGRSGVDRQRFFEIMTSSLFDAPAYKNYGARILSGDFEPGFAAPLAEKDIRLALAAAEDLRVPMPLANLIRDHLLSLMANNGERLDWAAIGMLPAVDAGAAR